MEWKELEPKNWFLFTYKGHRVARKSWQAELNQWRVYTFDMSGINGTKHFTSEKEATEWAENYYFAFDPKEGTNRDLNFLLGKIMESTSKAVTYVEQASEAHQNFEYRDQLCELKAHSVAGTLYLLAEQLTQLSFPSRI